MTPEKHRAHALLARTLIRACGGLVEAASACRLEKSRLQEFCDATRLALMPLDVVEELQDYCGRQIYFEGLAAMLPCTGGARSLEEESCSLTEAVASLQAYVRKHRSHLSRNELHSTEAMVQGVEAHLRCLRTAASQRGAS